MIDIVKQVDEYKRSKQKIYPCHSNRASQLADECERRLVYYRTSWDKQIIPDVGLQYIFDEGNNQEEAVLNDLRNAGFSVTEQQRPFTWPEHQITGTIDARVGLNGNRFPVEIKSMNPHIFDNMDKVEDLKKYPWTSKYLGQILIYLLLGNSEEGLLILKNKTSGRLKQMEIRLADYLDLAEELIQKADRINQHIKNGTLPPKINVFKVCSDCPFQAICLPEVLSKGGIEFIDNEALEKSLNRRLELAPLTKEYATIDKQVKEELKRYMQDKTIINCGKWVIEKKVNKNGAVSFEFEKLKEDPNAQI